jgi:hypothetical protein
MPSASPFLSSCAVHLVVMLRDAWAWRTQNPALPFHTNLWNLTSYLIDKFCGPVNSDLTQNSEVLVQKTNVCLAISESLLQWLYLVDYLHGANVEFRSWDKDWFFSWCSLLLK